MHAGFSRQMGYLPRRMGNLTRLELPVARMTRRLFAHILIAVFSWALFGYYWGLVAQRRITENTIRGIQILLLLVLAIWSITALWIQHNRRRFAGRPDRRTRRSGSGEIALTDAAGQRVRIDPGTRLTTAPCVEVEVEASLDQETGAETRLKHFRQVNIPGQGGV